MNLVGSIAVSLGLNAVEFVAGLTRSEYQAKKFAKDMEKVGRDAGRYLGIGISSAATAIGLMVKLSIDAADKLNDLSKQTGISASTLGGLGFAAKQSGTDLEGVAKSVGKLNLQIASAAAGNEQAQRAFNVLGISMRTLRDSTPDQVLAKLADEFTKYEDGPNKAAIANALFGKSYQSILPLLDEGGKKLTENVEYFKRYSGLTDEVIAKSDEFNDTMTKLGLLSGSFGRQLSIALLPALQALADEFVTAQEKGDGFKAGAEAIVGTLKVMTTAALYTGTAFAQMGALIGANAARLQAFARLDFKGVGLITDAVSEDIDALAAKRDKILAAINNPPPATIKDADGPKPPKPPRRPDAPQLPDAGTGKAAADAQKKILDGQLKDLRAASEEEKAILAARNSALDVYYDAGYLSLKQYFDARKEALAEDSRNTAANYEKEVAILRQRIAKPGLPEKDRQDAINELAETERKYTRARISLGEKDVQLWGQSERAAKEYKRSIDEVTASILEMQGKTAEANQIRLKNQTEDFRKSLESTVRTGSPEDAAKAAVALSGIGYLAEQRKKQDELSEAALKYGSVIEALGIDQARLDLAAQTGLQSEIEGYNAKAELADKYVGKLMAQLEIQRNIAAQLGEGPAKIAALEQIERMKLGIDQLKQSADGLKNKLDGIFTDNLATFFNDITEGTKSVSQSFKDMGKSIGQTISRMVNEDLAKQLYKALFGSSGVGQSPGGLLATLFGGGGGAGAGGELASLIGGGLKGMTPGSSTAAGGGGAGLGGLIGSLLGSFSMDSMLASGAGGLASMFSAAGLDLDTVAQLMGYTGITGFARGTNSARGGVSLVGERGAELVNIPKGAQVIPNEVLMSRRSDRKQRAGPTIVQNITNNPGVSRASAAQQLADAARHARAAQSRNS